MVKCLCSLKFHQNFLMSVLDPSEEEIFNKPAYYEKKKANLILSNVRVVIADKKTIIQDINYLSSEIILKNFYLIICDHK